MQITIDNAVAYANELLSHGRLAHDITGARKAHAFGSDYVVVSFEIGGAAFEMDCWIEAGRDGDRVYGEW